jgi:hypothetical protein
MRLPAKKPGETIANDLDPREGETAEIIDLASRNAFPAVTQRKGRSDGMVWRTGPSAQVLAPGAGSIEYAGPLKGWGGVVILRLDGGYRVVLAGLDRVLGLTGRRVAAAQARAVRDGTAEDCGMGPVCGAMQKADILGWIAKGRAEGARLLTGGVALDGEDYDHGCFIAPTVFDRVAPAMAIAREEIFGPVLAIITVRTFEEAVEVANGVAYALSSSIFTNDLKRALTYMERAEVGLAHVNLMTALKEPQLSFGGVKESGAGLPEAGSSGIEFFTHHKVCYVKYR